MDVNKTNPEFDLEKDNRVLGVDPSLDSPSEKGSVARELTKPEDDFPEGGLRAWLVVAGAAGVLFCGFGYANAFGYVVAIFQHITDG